MSVSILGMNISTVVQNHKPDTKIQWYHTKWDSQEAIISQAQYTKVGQILSVGIYSKIIIFCL